MVSWTRNFPTLSPQCCLNQPPGHVALEWWRELSSSSHANRAQRWRGRSWGDEAGRCSSQPIGPKLTLKAASRGQESGPPGSDPDWDWLGASRAINFVGDIPLDPDPGQLRQAVQSAKQSCKWESVGEAMQSAPYVAPRPCKDIAYQALAPRSSSTYFLI